MPPPRDLTGLRFGKLTVLGQDGRVVWGQAMSAWLCRCDCSAEIRVPRKRLTTRDPVHQLHSCEACRARPCDICGAPVPLVAKAKTCSPECKAERDRRYQMAYYHEVRAHDPDDQQRRRDRNAAWWAGLTTDEKLQVWRKKQASEDPDHVRARNRAWHQRRVADDPEYAERKRQQAQATVAATDPEARRKYQREYARRRRARSAEIEMLRTFDAMKGAPDEQ